MKLTGKTRIAIILLLIVLLVSFFCADAGRVETQYSNGFFPAFITFYRKICGVFPFSIGDIVYGFFFTWLLIKILRFFFRKGERWKRLGTGLLIMVGVYVAFNLLWGINYSRQGIAHQLQLQPGKYNKADLSELNCLLAEKVNNAREQLGERSTYQNHKKIFKQLPDVFTAAQKTWPFLKYKHPSLKSSLWSWLGNYAGFTGYYNPFTAEAQVNTNIPVFMIPFTACHEVAHQLGYAKENEANFVGYLAAVSSGDPYFQYSAYLDLFLYANRRMNAADSVAAKLYRRELHKNVVADINELIAYSRKYTSPFEPLIWWAYGKFLEQHSQPQGIKSYDEVISLLIAYHKKTGRL